jgi:hypothetical protein
VAIALDQLLGSNTGGSAVTTSATAASGSRVFAVYDSTNQPMFLLLQMWVGGWSGDPDVSTPNVLETQVDYVSVWQK